MNRDYEKIVRHYEQCFTTHGDNHLGMDWPKLEDNHKRFQVMLDVVQYDLRHAGLPCVLDFGCGTAHLLEYIREKNIVLDSYIGLDLSELFVARCQEKYPEEKFILGDVLDDDFQWPVFDYAVMNGVFTEKRDLTHSEMWEYFKQVIGKVFRASRRGIAFNVMSKNVDWEREDLFHLSMDQLSGWVTRELSRNIIIRQDYGLYEYTAYLYKG
ncbi:MAG: hypothetical protein RLY35_801 [Bacteroidota bacterium]|jgi:SAM-dependent methyltransferase